MRDIEEWRPGFYSEFRHEPNEHSGLAWGAIFENIFKFQEMHAFVNRHVRCSPEIKVFQILKPRKVLQDVKELFGSLAPEKKFVS